MSLGEDHGDRVPGIVPEGARREGFRASRGSGLVLASRIDCRTASGDVVLSVARELRSQKRARAVARSGQTQGRSSAAPAPDPSMRAEPDRSTRPERSPCEASPRQPDAALPSHRDRSEDSPRRTRPQAPPPLQGARRQPLRHRRQRKRVRILRREPIGELGMNLG